MVLVHMAAGEHLFLVFFHPLFLRPHVQLLLWLVKSLCSNDIASDNENCTRGAGGRACEENGNIRLLAIIEASEGPHQLYDFTQEERRSRFFPAFPSPFVLKDFRCNRSTALHDKSFVSCFPWACHCRN